MRGRKENTMHSTILLVDDDNNLLSSMKRSLRNEDFEVLCATSADEALALLSHTSVDIVVSDQDMPGMKGTEFLQKVHRNFPETIRFMLTGQATLEVAVSAINDGAISRFFTKPCNMVDLGVTIKQTLEHKELMQQAKKLLQEVHKKNRLLKQLEETHPGISKVERDNKGAILVDEDHEDCRVLIRKINETLEET